MIFNNHKILNFLFSFVFLLGSFSAFGQLSGRIVTGENDLPIEYGTLVLKKDNAVISGTISKQDGSFFFEVSEVGSFTLEVSFLGYVTQILGPFNLDKQNKSQAFGTIRLEPTPDLLDEVVLKTNRATVKNKIDRQVYRAAAFSSSKGGSAIDVLRNIPSLNIDAQGHLSVRGAKGFVVLLNNKPIQSDIQTLLRQLPANSVKNIEVITAPSAKYDAEGKAGIINILTSKEALKGDYLQINTLLGAPAIEPYDGTELPQRFGADVTYNTVGDRWNFSGGLSFQRNDISGRREGEVSTIINGIYREFPSDGERSFDEENFSGRLTLDFKASKKDLFSLGFFAGKRSKDRRADILYYNNTAYPLADPNNILYSMQYFNENLRIRKSDFALGSFDYSHAFDNEAKIKASLLYEYTLLGGPTTNLNLGYPNTDIVLQEEYNTNDNPLYGLRINLDYTFAPFPFGFFEMGYQYRNLDHTGDFVYERKNNSSGLFELVPEFSSEVNLKRIIHAGYLQYSTSFGSWNIAAGMRLEQMQRDLSLKDKTGTLDEDYALNFTKLFPSANVSFALNDASNLKLTYSKRIERTTTFKMNPFPEREHSETLEQGDPNLKPELIDQIELGFDHKNDRGNTLFTTLYYRKVDQLINRVNTVYNDTILNRIYSNVGKGNTLGLEVGTEFTVGENWKNFASFNGYNYQIKGNFDKRPIALKSSIYSVNLNSTYNFSPTTFLQFTFNYLSERITAQGVDSRFYSPNLTFVKRFWNNQLTATLQWKNMDMGWLNSNEQRITTSRPNDFYTTTNYVYEVDVVLLNLSYNFNNRKNKSKFIKSEFGGREF